MSSNLQENNNNISDEKHEEIMEIEAIEDTSRDYNSNDDCDATTSSQELQSKSDSFMSQNSNVSNFETDFLTAKRTPKINIMTPELAAALDRGNVSSRSATYVLAATLKSVGFDTRNVNLSYKTIQRQRIIHRKEIAKGLKEDLKFNDNYVVHWDGKLLSDIVGTETVDRLPVLLTSSGSEQLLGIPKINSGSGIEQAFSCILNYGAMGVSKFLPRNDYREFLELSSIFLGATPKDNYTFKCPGAMSHARWMSKAIYCLKIFIFRTEFKITPKELNNLRHICIFIVTTYIKAWFTSSSAILAPNNDLTLMQQLILYNKINSTVSQAALKKMVRHLWYLSDQLAIMSLFDDSIDLTVKKND
ncbi:uncharacterized protein LOC123274025 [Cotesia glomerata]|uniref:uncharacterized protein LOC123274025 n=1 Tax=Cotesia glomerata TaxID=32391 RepID=UPI001D00D115|nr:uncharacterized protein LOC123274025 [Cotesia glomerata]